MFFFFFFFFFKANRRDATCQVADIVMPDIIAT